MVVGVGAVGAVDMYCLDLQENLLWGRELTEGTGCSALGSLQCPRLRFLGLRRSVTERGEVPGLDHFFFNSSTEV